jgi:tRNA threonylcarbamoyladenosine biosynthesis protein TsaE
LIDFPSTFTVKSEQETAKLAADFVSGCEAGNRIVLNGNLGAGKTFFIKSALSSIDIKDVNSPSFAIVNEHQNSFHIYHFDFYRLRNVEELFDIGWQDYLNDDDAIIFIEWGNRLPSVLPKQRIEINISVKNENEREFSFEKLA